MGHKLVQDIYGGKKMSINICNFLEEIARIVAQVTPPSLILYHNYDKQSKVSLVPHPSMSNILFDLIQKQPPCQITTEDLALMAEYLNNYWCQSFSEKPEVLIDWLVDSYWLMEDELYTCECVK